MQRLSEETVPRFAFLRGFACLVTNFLFLFVSLVDVPSAGCWFPTVVDIAEANDQRKPQDNRYLGRKSD